MEQLYHAALEKSGEECEALLANSDSEVRRGVEALLAQGTSSERVLDHPAWEQAAISRWMSVWTISIPIRALTNSGARSDFPRSINSDQFFPLQSLNT